MKKFLSDILLVGFFCVSTASFAEVSAEEYFDLGRQNPLLDGQVQELLQAKDTLTSEGVAVKSIFVISQAESQLVIGALDDENQCFTVIKGEVNVCTAEQTKLALDKQESLLDVIGITKQVVGGAMLGVGIVAMFSSSAIVMPALIALGGGTYLVLRGMKDVLNI